MNASEILQVIQMLKACGATHFKSRDFEIALGASASHEQLPIPPSVVVPAQAQPLSPQFQGNVEATEKLKGLIDTLKMDDSQLIDKIFPAGAGG
jgi:cell division protein FtsX